MRHHHSLFYCPRGTFAQLAGALARAHAAAVSLAPRLAEAGVRVRVSLAQALDAAALCATNYAAILKVRAMRPGG